MADDKDKGKEEEELLKPVGEGAEDLGSAAPEQRGKADDDEDRGSAAADEDEHEDRRLGGDREEDDDRRDPRDMTQSEKRARRRRARDRDRTELRYLRHRNEQLERGTTELAQRLDKLEEGGHSDKISRIRGALKNADATIIRLAADGEGAQALEAQNLKANLESQLRAEEERLEKLRLERGGTEREARGAEEREPARRPMPAEVRRNLEEWYDRNPWFSAEDPDTDSRLAMALDQAVAADGYDPRDPDYYEELDRRIAQYIPRRARRNGRDDDDRDDDRDRGERRRGRSRDDDDDRDDRRINGRDRFRDDDRRGRDRDDDRGARRREPSGPVFRVGGKDRPLRENEVHISKERRQALEEMGVLDDPVLRNRYLKSFQKYDREHDPRRNR